MVVGRSGCGPGALLRVVVRGRASSRPDDEANNGATVTAMMMLTMGCDVTLATVAQWCGVTLAISRQA